MLTRSVCAIILALTQRFMPKNKHLVIAMLDREVTQIEVAKKAGLSESRLSRIVNGHDAPTRNEKESIAKALRRPVDAVFPSAEALAS